ncbi:MAG TPA: GTPase domain-containing protein [Thermoanaerobaculia bacterium]|nr:GTPase domain-containing protein [Thermoanaerobaculia bacterium]
MAQIDTERQRVVVRIVYDGPALAGKTTTVRALGRLFGAEVFASEDEAGRTLHFDWMEYEGGRFGDLSVCCQVITVPGQPALLERRLRLLDTADAVVFVADSSSAELDRGLTALSSLRSFLQLRPTPRPGLILQANKRDAPDAVDLEVLRDRLGVGPTVGVTEAVALDGTGVRQTFVFAVRLALDRVHELQASGSLPTGAPEIASGPALLAALTRLEAANGHGEAKPAVKPPPRSPRWELSTAGREQPPLAPSASLPSGRVWPPVEGRLVLHEATSRPLGLSPRTSGSWVAVSGPWLLHSAPASTYREEEAGRNALLEWARWHATLGRRLSPRRCVVLAEDHAPGWRLWQIVHREETLGMALSRALAQRDPEILARSLLQTVRVLSEACDSVAVTGLRISLETVGLLESAPAYVALVPQPNALAGLAAMRPPGLVEQVQSLAPLLAGSSAFLVEHGASLEAGISKLGRAWGIEETGAALVALLARLRQRV